MSSNRGATSDSTRWLCLDLERYVPTADVARVANAAKGAAPVAAGPFTISSDGNWNGIQFFVETSVSHSAIRIL